MRRFRIAALGATAFVVVAAGILLGSQSSPRGVVAQGVGRASWTPSISTTETLPSQFLTPEDSITFSSEATWSKRQADGLHGYLRDGLRYTHEVNDRTGRLSATGFWASNHPDPAFDRDDDDGDGRWEEAEVIAGTEVPATDAAYTSLVQFSRWHGKREGGACIWAWDRRLGSAEVLSQLSRDLFGEWQAERFTLTYDTLDYPRTDAKPPLPAQHPKARCRETPAKANQDGVVVTFSSPIPWSTFMELRDIGVGRWTAWEAIGSRGTDSRIWTCGGPVYSDIGLDPCIEMGVRPDGVTAAVGYYDAAAIDALRAHPAVARVDGLRDVVTSLLLDVGGFGVERPDLTVNDAYWELFLSD